LGNFRAAQNILGKWGGIGKDLLFLHDITENSRLAFAKQYLILTESLLNQPPF